MAASAVLKGRTRTGGGTPPPPPGPPEEVINLDGDSEQYTPITRWIVLFAVMLGTLLEILDTSIVNVALPEMMGNLGVTINEIGWVSTGYIIANVIVLPLTGWLSSYYGRRKYLTVSICLFTVASFLCGHAGSLTELVAFRILQGAGGAALLSSAQATLMEVFPRKQVAMVQAIFAVGVVFAPTVGPIIGGWITDNYSWPWIFYVNIPIGILAAFMVWNFLKDSRFQVKPKGKIDIFGIFLLAVGLGGMQTILAKGDEEGWFQSNLIIGLAVASVIALYVFVVWELYTDNPAVNLRVLKNKGFTAAITIAGIMGFALYGGIFILPLFLQEVRGFSAVQAGIALFPSGVATIIMLPIIGRLLKTMEPRFFIPVGAVVMVFAFTLLSRLTINSTYADIYPALILRGFAASCLFLPLSLSALAGLHPADLPGGTGLYNLARQIGGSLGIAFLATFIDHQGVIVRSDMANHLNSASPAFNHQLGAMTHGFMSKGFALDTAHAMAMEAMRGISAIQSAVITYNDGFKLIAGFFLLVLPLFFLLDKGTVHGRKIAPRR